MEERRALVLGMRSAAWMWAKLVISVRLRPCTPAAAETSHRWRRYHRCRACPTVDAGGNTKQEVLDKRYQANHAIAEDALNGMSADVWDKIGMPLPEVRSIVPAETRPRIKDASWIKSPRVSCFSPKERENASE